LLNLVQSIALNRWHEAGILKAQFQSGEASRFRRELDGIALLGRGVKDFHPHPLH